MIRIVTDSSCDLPDELLARHRITVVPLTIRFGDEDFVDREQSHQGRVLDQAHRRSGAA